MTERPPSAAERFDAIADSYDQSGVEFFGPLGERLVEMLEPRPGERALDIGCGRGAVTLPLARAVAPVGSVTGVDVSPVMVAKARAAAELANLDNISVEVADAADLSFDSDFDIVASSLVLFFLPDPLAALTDWVSLLKPDGRIGMTTFGQLDDASRALDALFDPWLPPGLLDPRTVGAKGPFASDDGVADLARRAGATRVETRSEPMTIRFPDVAAWQRFSMSTGQRAMWRLVPDDERPRLVDRAAAILADVRDADASTLVWQMRFTFGRRG